VPYQSLIKVFLRERIDLEHQHNFAIGDRSAPYEVKNKRAEGRRKKLT